MSSSEPWVVVIVTYTPSPALSPVRRIARTDEPFEECDRVLGTRKRCELVAHALRRGAVGRIGEDLADHLADVVRLALLTSSERATPSDSHRAALYG